MSQPRFQREQEPRSAEQGVRPRRHRAGRHRDGVLELSLELLRDAAVLPGGRPAHRPEPPMQRGEQSHRRRGSRRVSAAPARDARRRDQRRPGRWTLVDIARRCAGSERADRRGLRGTAPLAADARAKQLPVERPRVLLDARALSRGRRVGNRRRLDFSIAVPVPVPFDVVLVNPTRLLPSTRELIVELRVKIRQLTRRHALRRGNRRASQVSPGQRFGAANRPEPRNHRRLRQLGRLAAQEPVAHVPDGPQVLAFGLGARRRRRSGRGKGRRRFGRRRGNFLSRRRHPRGETLDADVVVKHGTREPPVVVRASADDVRGGVLPVYAARVPRGGRSRSRERSKGVEERRAARRGSERRRRRSRRGSSAGGVNPRGRSRERRGAQRRDPRRGAVRDPGRLGGEEGGGGGARIIRRS